ncbi:MAG: WecB/TagA/CpsF family glycosyltransferase [Ignavibacteria bacterium]|nr:WecB/TagA/CpsF family glycosyltransferase [Ignavibacteria bacterium]
MNKRIEILGTPLDCVTMDESIEIIDQAIQNNQQILHTAINAGKIVLMCEDEDLYESTTKADLINADGQAIVWASRLLGKPLPERVSGIDLMDNIVQLASKRGYKIYFLGAKDEVVLKVVNHYEQKFGPEIIAGYRNGYFDDNRAVINDINLSGADIIFVGIRSPKKEIFLFENRDQLIPNLLMGVGGSFDVISGAIKRAPLWMQNNGLEWLYRVIQEPRRMWRRYLIGNIKFIMILLKEFLNFRRV